MSKFGEEITLEELVEAMTGLLGFTHGATFRWGASRFHALLYATVIRSSNTFSGTCILGPTP